MSMIDNGVDRGLESSSPLFASSWMALYLLLKQEFESLRDDEPRTDDGPTESRPEQPN